MKTRISSKKYNDKLNAIFEPEIERLKKQEARAKSVLDALQERTDIDFCGLEEWQVKCQEYYLTNDVTYLRR